MLEAQLLALGIDGKWLEPLLKTFEKYEINTPRRQAALLVNVGMNLHRLKYCVRI